MTSDDTKLKPCPFCPESKVSLCDNQADYIPAVRYFVACGRCGSSSGHCKTEEKAIALWNTRNPSADYAGLLEAVKALLKLEIPELYGEEKVWDDVRKSIARMGEKK